MFSNWLRKPAVVIVRQKNHIRPLSSGDLYSYTLCFVYRTLYPLQDIFEGSKVLAAIMKPTIPSDRLKQDLILSLIIASSFDKSQPSRDGMPIADSSESILTGNGNAWAKPLYRQGKDVFPFLSVFLFIYYIFGLQRKDPIADEVRVVIFILPENRFKT